MSSKPNFLMIVTDQHCADWLSCAGHSVVKTPNIDRLAARGVRFTQFHTASPVCMPNRASLLTGRYPSVHGLKYNGCALPYDARTFVEQLKDNGYRTAAIGKSHLQPFTGIDMSGRWASLGLPEQDAWKTGFEGMDLECPRHYQSEDLFHFPTPYYGFDHVDMVTGHGDTAGGHYFQWFKQQTSDWERLRDPTYQAVHDYSCPQAKRTLVPEELYTTAYIEQQTVQWLQRQSAEPDPFFLFVSFPDPHHPFNPPGRYWDAYQPEQFAVTYPLSDFSAPPPPLAFAHQRLAKGGTTDTPQEAFAASLRHCQEAMALSAGMLAMIDDAVGRILDTLSEHGLDDNTVVIFTADHGDYMGDGQLLLKGPWMRDSIHHVPFIWADCESGHPTHSTTDVIGSAIDLAPTILARADVNPYYGIQGRNLLDDLKNDQGRAELLIEFNDNVPRLGFNRAARSRTLLTPQWRLTVYAGEGWGELYHHQDDPAHLINRWDDPNCQTTKAALMEALTVEVTLAMDESPRARMRA